MYLLKSKNNSKYLGWVPLKSEKRLKYYYKNITKKIDFDVLVQNVPLYYIICEFEPNNRSLAVKKILNNPIIELQIDLNLLKYDLLDLVKLYNISLDLLPLKTYDYGRWFLTFFMNN